MKALLIFATTLALGISPALTHAQWGGFLDPEIIREAGRKAATGDLSDFEIEETPPIYMPPPSAREIAKEIENIREEKSRQEEEQRVQSMRIKVNKAIQQAYIKEFAR